MKTICLCMIVKNEAHIISRCLESVKPLIDTWFIIDTGSTDGTQEKIKEIFKDIPGEIIDRPWVNFAFNRTELLQLADKRADYNFMIDADEILIFEENFSAEQFKNNLSCDVMNIMAKMGSIDYFRPQMTKSGIKCEYKSILHEYLHIDPPFSADNALGFFNRPIQDSSRNNDPKKYHRDALLLENALIDEPNNDRYMFYLAQSYRDSHQYQKALENYIKRAQMGGWIEEVFYSLYQIAGLKRALNHGRDEVIQAYLTAYEVAPWRSESLHDAANFCRLNNLFHQAFILAAHGLGIKYPAGSLFVDRTIYDYGLLDEYAISAYWSSRPLESLNACERLLSEQKIPADQIDRVKTNKQFALDRLTGKNKEPNNIQINIP